MEITNALLVAIMFIVLLTMGIGNIVMALATIVDKRTPVKTDLIHTSWVILLLLVYLNLFWHVLDILTIEEWAFLEFLYIVAGAIIIFFATQVLLPDPSSPDANNLRDYYFGICRQFFFFLALLQIWVVGVDFLLGKGFTTPGIFNVVAFFLFITMASSQHAKLHNIGTGLAWLLYLCVSVFKGMGIFQ
jgi:hypothetical protein